MDFWNGMNSLKLSIFINEYKTKGAIHGIGLKRSSGKTNIPSEYLLYLESVPVGPSVATPLAVDLKICRDDTEFNVQNIFWVAIIKQ